jgi:hypothetical protein
MNDIALRRYLETYGGYETEELLRIWKENDRRITGAEELFEAIRQVLVGRNFTIPPQNEFAAIAPDGAATGDPSSPRRDIFEGYYAFDAVIIRNSKYYLPKFKKFVDRGNGFSLTWNGAAFFFGPIWALYRKLYFWGAIEILVSFIPLWRAVGFLQSHWFPLGLDIVLSVVWGTVGNYLYFRKARRMIRKAESCSPSTSNLNLLLARQGGVNARLAVVVAILLELIQYI